MSKARSAFPLSKEGSSPRCGGSFALDLRSKYSWQLIITLFLALLVGTGLAFVVDSAPGVPFPARTPLGVLTPSDTAENSCSSFWSLSLRREKTYDRKDDRARHHQQHRLFVQLPLQSDGEEKSTVGDDFISSGRVAASAVETHTESSSNRTTAESAAAPATAISAGSLAREDGEAMADSSYRTAFRNTILSVLAAVAFGAGLWALVGPATGKEFFAGYLVEKSLSVDNLFVFLLLFDFFEVPPGYQNRVLTWGIYGSVVMRAVMIALGAAILERFHGIILLFAGILIYSAVQVLVDVEDYENDVDDIEDNPVVRFSRFLCESRDECDLEDFNRRGLANPVVMLSRSLFPSTDEYDGDRFFTVEDGVKKATPLFSCMVAVELSDVVFAVDSIPAVFGVTEDPLIVFSSNMFAILGLRSLYPVLSSAVNDLKYLEPAVAVILAFIGGKMIAEYFGYGLPTEVALAMIVSFLGIGVGASMWEKDHQQKRERDS